MQVKYSDIKVKLAGEDGNIFFIIDRVSAALRRADVNKEEIKEFIDEVTSSNSYDEALGVVMRWVDIY